MVRVHPDPPQTPRLGPKQRHFQDKQNPHGAIAQLGERLLCKQEVTGSIPVGSTRFSKFMAEHPPGMLCHEFFVRLLFKNSEEVKRIRFSQTGFVWVVIALLNAGACRPQRSTKRSL